jgi:hypothetical protein
MLWEQRANTAVTAGIQLLVAQDEGILPGRDTIREKPNE